MQVFQTGITCNPNFGNANVGAIQDGINYLNQRGGTCVVESRSCSRISCSFNSAILLCNDVRDPPFLPLSSFHFSSNSEQEIPQLY